MRRLNFLDDEPWDEVFDDVRVRWFGHPFGADMLGASLRELLPGSPGGSLHMHYGVEEMFFVLSGTPTVRTPERKRRRVGNMEGHSRYRRLRESHWRWQKCARVASSGAGSLARGRVHAIGLNHV